MPNVHEVTKIVMSVEDHKEYLKSVHEGSFGTSNQGVLEVFYNIEVEVDSRIDKGYIFVHERDKVVPEYMTISQFRSTYGTI